MRRFDVPNINTVDYWNQQYRDRCDVNFEHTLRQNVYLKLLSRSLNICALGCGLSPFAVMASKTARVTGLDISPVAIAFMQRNYPLVTWQVGDARETQFRDGQFDGVLAGEIIEHMEDPDALLREMDRICGKYGRMVLSTPRLEFQDPEHLWELDAEWFATRGFATDEVQSDLFPGRSYIFAWKDKS